jgi:hypothetical protein
VTGSASCSWTVGRDVDSLKGRGRRSDDAILERIRRHQAFLCGALY